MSYHLPKTVEKALSIIDCNTDFAIVAGGTDIMVRRTLGTRTFNHFIDLSQIGSMREIVFDGTTLSIGAGVSLASLAESKTIQSRFPTLREAANSIASPNIRSNATIAGNLLCENRCIYYDQSEFWRTAAGECLKSGGDICIATGSTKNCYSVFISDLTPVLICLNASVEYVDAMGIGTRAIEDLYTGEGTQPHTLPNDAIITRIVIPAKEDGTMFFRKVRQRESIDFTNLTLAMRLSNEQLSLAASGIGPAPITVRLERNAKETSNAHTLALLLLKESQIIDNLSYQRAYRKSMVKALIEEGLRQLDLLK